MKPGSLTRLEPSGPVKACNGIALPLPFIEKVIDLFKIKHSYINISFINQHLLFNALCL